MPRIEIHCGRGVYPRTQARFLEMGKNKRGICRGFYWQSGYGAFSVSPSHVSSLRRYIAEQETHHHKETFQDEFRRLLRKYGLEWDEQYIWD
jgi:hypothetical protein